MQSDISALKRELLNDGEFIDKLRNRIQEGPQIPISNDVLGQLIEEIQSLLQTLIKKKMQQQLWNLIADNNRVLEEIKQNLVKNQSNILQPNREMENSNFLPDHSFSDIHHIITEERRKAMECMDDAEVEKSLSVLEKYEDVIQKVNGMSKKVRAMEDRYETNFKSLWNVLSMTEAAVFDHIKQNKNVKKLPQTKSQIDKQKFSIFGLFK